ncbi:exonuclease SbcCD subunit D [Chloroflexota bacterium]
MVRFLHTSDWQLGMTRHFFSEGAQERYNQARFDAVRALGKVAKKENCQFVAVCGDVFESNQVDRKTVARAFEALRGIPVPVYILPGNHDPLNEASVYVSNAFVQGKPANVTVVTDATPIQIGEDIQLVGCPWMSKRMALNPFDDAVKSLEPVLGFTRIILAHGINNELDKALVKVLRKVNDVPGFVSDNLCLLQWLSRLTDKLLHHIHRFTYS